MQNIRIGRSSANELVLNDNTVSRQHAIVTLHSDGSATIRDLNSTSGTFVDGKRLTTEEMPITNSSSIRLGGSTVSLREIREAANRGASGSPIVLTNSRRLGRATDNELVFPASDVSRYHARLGLDPNGNVVVEDLNSGNGTFVNGERIQGQRRLNPGDTLRLGKNTQVDWAVAVRGGHLPAATKDKNLILGIAAAVLVLIVAGLGLWKFMNHKMDAQDIYSKYKSSVGMIYNQYTYKVTLDGHAPSEYNGALAELDNLVVDADGDVSSGMAGGTGTGFFISEDGKMMTNKHVLFPVGKETEDAEKIRKTVENYLYGIAQQTGNPAFARLAQNVKVDYTILWTGVALNDTHASTKDDFMPATPVRKSDNDEIDIAILQLNNKQTPAGTQIVDIQNYSKPEHRRLGDKVYTLGFPKSFTIGTTDAGLEANNQSGEITQERGEYTYGHNITIHQGASGSPVFDAYGRFAGVIVSGFLGLSQGYNHAVMPEKAVSIAQ